MFYRLYVLMIYSFTVAQERIRKALWICIMKIKFYHYYKCSLGWVDLGWTPGTYQTATAVPSLEGQERKKIRCKKSSWEKIRAV